VFTALIYYRATKWWVKINKTHDKKMLGLWAQDGYHISETSTKPANTTPLDDMLLQDFFGHYDDTLDDVNIDQSAYTKIDRVFEALKENVKETKLYEKTWSRLFGKEIPTVQWADIFEQMRGYKQFLEKVERPVIEKELQNDPEFINKILPRAILFGVETKLLPIIEDLLAKSASWWYSSYDWSPLSPATFSLMNAAFISSSVAPQRSSSSWFSGGWGFSWWWGWGGGGWSW
jgi:hypothetical protein